MSDNDTDKYVGKVKSISVSRRGFLRVAAGLAGAAALAGCAQTAPPAPTTAPAAAPTAASAAAPAAAPTTAAPAVGSGTVKEVVLGALFPLTGSAGSIGMDCKNGIDMTVDIINQGLNIPGVPLGQTPGLPGLGGAKVRVVYADHQGLPEKGQSEVERLVTQEKVHAIIGTYMSSVALTASQAAERLGIPMMNGDCSSPTLTARGLKWFWRTGAHDKVFVGNEVQMLDDIQKEKGIKIKSVGIIYDNSLAGTDFSNSAETYAKEHGYEVLVKIGYPTNTTELTSEVQKLVSAKPDVVLSQGYTAGDILLVKAFKQADFNPQGVIAYGGGFTDPKFFDVLGKDSQYYISKAAFSADLADKKGPGAKQIVDMFQKKTGGPLTENSGRNVDTVFALLDAFNRAKSVDPKAVQKAINETDIPENMTIMPYKGVKFDETGQNMYASSVNTQVFEGRHYTVWPFNLASKQLMWPRPKWADIK